MKRSSCLSCRHPEGDQKQTYTWTSKNHCLPSYLEAVIYFFTFLFLFICYWSVTKSYVTLCDPKHPGFLTLHRLPEFAQTHVLWVGDAIQPSQLLLSPSLKSSPASGSFPMSWLFASGGQSIGASASASVPPVNTQGWFPLGLTGLISLLSKGLSRVFSSITIWKHQLFCDFFLVHLSYLYVTTGKTIALTIHFCQQSGISAF